MATGHRASVGELLRAGSLTHPGGGGL